MNSVHLLLEVGSCLDKLFIVMLITSNSGLMREVQPLEDVMPFILQLCLVPQPREAILQGIDKTENRRNYNKYVNQLVTTRYLKYVDPRFRSSRSEYITTLKGKKYLNAILL
jgi:hypothetical protein